MSEDITFCVDALDKSCNHTDCERHPANIKLRWRAHSYMHLYGTELCEMEGKKEVEDGTLH